MLPIRARFLIKGKNGSLSGRACVKDPTCSLHYSSFFWVNQSKLYIKDYTRYLQKGTTMETIRTVQSEQIKVPGQHILEHTEMILGKAGAVIVRIGFWGVPYYSYSRKYPPKPYSNY